MRNIKSSLLLFLLFALNSIFSVSCCSTKNNLNENVSKEPHSTKTDNKMEIKTDTIVIKPLGQKEYMLKVGDILSYTSTEHPSVGSTFEYGLIRENAIISDKKVIEFFEKKRVYKNEKMNNPDPKKPPITGADEANVTLLFKAVDKGKVKLTITNLFRGRTESTNEYYIVVE
jgi:hypothetical protein